MELQGNNLKIQRNDDRKTAKQKEKKRNLIIFFPSEAKIYPQLISAHYKMRIKLEADTTRPSHKQPQHTQ